MSRWVNLAAALLIVLGIVLFWAAIWGLRRPVRGPIPVKAQLFYSDVQPPSKFSPWLPMGMAAAGSLVLFVDAIRRPRGPSKVASYVATLSGILLIGVPALLYYAVIGWRAPGETDQEYGSGFCRNCIACTTNESAGNTFTFNFIWGTRFLGRSSRCKTCGSQVRTKWIFLGWPVIPVGSYRVISVDFQEYISRRSAFDWRHVGIVYGVTVLVVLFGLLVSALSIYR
jgi:hypothetical protein